MIVVIIISVLASIALPKMAKMIKRTTIPEAMTMFSWMKGRMEIAYVADNSSYKAIWATFLGLGDNANIAIGIDRPENTPGGHFCYTVEVFADKQSYQLKAYYTDNTFVTCPVGTPPGTYMGIPDYLKFDMSHITNKLSYSGYGVFNGYKN